MVKIRRALLSVSDKTGLVPFAQALHNHQIDILSTGGTAKLLRENNIPVTDVSEYTGHPEIMDGRVKTLHPKIHGALLGREGTDDSVMAEHGITPIDMVVVNLYPFTETVNKGSDFATIIENIDIGGPTMVRAAAKNHQRVSVIVNPEDYDPIIAELAKNNSQISQDTRTRLCQKAFSHTASYDSAIANYLSTGDTAFPESMNLNFKKRMDLRYGENPHQQAAFYTEEKNTQANIANAIQHQGKALSYNNIADTDAALECVKSFGEQAACVIVKHANPCGVAIAENIKAAYERAFLTDPTSSFGGIIAFNQCVDEDLIKEILQKQFVEVIIAPEFSQHALEACAQKPNVRILSCGYFDKAENHFDYKRVGGGLLIQDTDLHEISIEDLEIVTKRQPTEAQLNDLLFAWKVAKFVKSNAIVYAKNQATVGIGAGQMSRVYSARIAGIKAQDENLVVEGSVMASDAFFPFRDGIDAAAAAGIEAVIQPGGSIRDEEVITAANEHNITMVFTKIRHFRH